MKKIYTKKDLEMCRILAISFTILLFICAIINWLMWIMEIPEFIKVLAFSGMFLMPILIIITCYMCIERYWFLEFYSENSVGSIQIKSQCAFSIALMLVLGCAALYNASELIKYVTYNWKLRDGLTKCVIIKGVIVGCWLLLWICSITKRKSIAMSTGIKRWLSIIGSILLIVVLFFATMKVNIYVVDQAEDVYWDKFIEHEEKYGALSKPFSRH